MNVEDVMTSREDVVTVEIPGTRDDVLDYLQTRTFSSVPAVKYTDDGEVFRGIVSRSSLIKRPDEDQLALLAEDVPATTADTSLADIADLMVSEGERRIPVLSGERLEGIVTVTDVVRAIAHGELDGEVTVGSVADEEVSTASPIVNSKGSRSGQTSSNGNAAETNVEFAGCWRSVSAAHSRPSWYPSSVDSRVYRYQNATEASRGLASEYHTSRPGSPTGSGHSSAGSFGSGCIVPDGELAGDYMLLLGRTQQHSPGQIRTAVNGSKGRYDWPLHHGAPLSDTGAPHLNTSRISPPARTRRRRRAVRRRRSRRRSSPGSTPGGR